MRAIILAAGSGLRLGEYTQDIPKTLVDVNGKSILERQISLESKNEVGEFLGIIKLSAAGSKILVKKYEELEKSHTGKFHDADSLNKAKLVDILQELIDSKIEISPLIISGKWCEIDTPKDLERAKKIFKNIDIE